ncbi:hypothetical protein [Thermus filiformis]|jgi:hypothetical protein|uniref:Uncharacterized protein n=1 Tax=Thermus filiformis TaxID=276 RepID=A0A0A2WVN5_THEFI|nr:hypothetical protein [Thermus filiformis]KGQ22857.1 hypothetical protein THFILI_02840 [Thermus filiformis]
MNALRMSLLLERLLHLVRPSYSPPPALVREDLEARTPLSLEVAYHPAQGRKGLVLIPKDAYFREVEALLRLD